MKKERKNLKLIESSLTLNSHIFPEPSYCRSVVVNTRTTSVTENLLDDKEQPDKLESGEVTTKISDQHSTPSPIDTRSDLSNVIVHTSDQNCGETENDRMSGSLYSSAEPYANQNNFYSDFQPADLYWPCNLSRTSLTVKNYSVQYKNGLQTSGANSNLRNPYNPYASEMKGNLMTMCQYNDYLSPPSSVSSSGYEICDNNNNSFINIDQEFHLSSIDDVIRDELKTENCFLVEEASAGNYTTLTNATLAAPLDMYHLHDYQRNYSGTNNHSTSSGGDSRSPDGYNNEDYESGMQNFTQLTNLTSRSSGIYATSPNSVVDHNLLSYDSSHVLPPTR
jgi:hypothetical protein